MKSLVLGFALLTGAPAVAQDTPPPPPPGGGGMMMRADTNGDGVVTKDEALAQAAMRFDRMDANHDGKLTRDEVDRGGRRMRDMRAGGDLPPPPQPQ